MKVYLTIRSHGRTPTYITENMVHTFRYYQDAALRFFHYSQSSKEFRYRNINHVLFNMATGSGKTDLMAGLFYIYTKNMVIKTSYS